MHVLSFATPSTLVTLAQPGSTGGGTTVVLVVAGVFGAIVLLVRFVVRFNFFNLYIQALFSNAHIGLIEMFGMRLRKVDLRTIVYSRIRAKKSGMDIPSNALETHYLAGGRVPNVISAMLAARGAKIDLP